MAQTTVAIIGGGIQGVCSALALARLGALVTIFEAAESLLDRASFRSEGKIHLGFVYANDPTGTTADLMLDAALHFAPLIDGWIGPVDWHRLRSRPFAYATLPDSQLSFDQLRTHYERIDHLYIRNYRTSGLHYLGQTPDSLLNGTMASWNNAVRLVAATAEVALDRSQFRDRMCRAIAAAPSIEVRSGCRVEEIAKTPGGFRVSLMESTPPTLSRGQGERMRQDFAAVVNCSWTDRLRLDKQLGIEPDRGWVYRLKYRVLGRLPGAACRPSLTFALGPYGDVVTYPDDRVYISWYPVCMRGWSRDLAPPAEWEPPCSGRTPAALVADVTEAVLREFGKIIPELRNTQVETVDAGVIFSWGTRDIDQPESELHRRSDIGVEGGNGYYSINTGKFTCGPLFASRLATLMQTEGVLS